MRKSKIKDAQWYAQGIVVMREWKIQDAQWYAARNYGYARMERFRMRSISKSRLTKGHEI